MMRWLDGPFIRDEWLPWLLMGFTVLLGVGALGYLVYEAKHCLRYEQHGYTLIGTQVGSTVVMQSVPNNVCVEWDQ